MELPKFAKGSFALMKAERQTGIVVTTEGSRTLSTAHTDADYFAIFDSLEKVHAHIKHDKAISNNKFEYVVYNSEHVVVAYV
ncbi:hypothetical protein [Taibaiella soli]|uniref:Uncharacterized protein n=1 Tax=Taibaiella soli TaxID=1649169 RepID=A0A2W2A791_9BACT|nr:hypothetical protein [Taibaiella soli]PZF71185.1 hypothetical protein DN068_19615 [Taibaiella soli]